MMQNSEISFWKFDGPKQSLNEVMLIYMDLACAYSFCHLFFLGYLGHPIFALVDKICLL